MADDETRDNADHPVGPYHPPRDKRFKKGAPSPNPLGRPPKPKTETGFLKSIDPFAAAVLAFDNTLLRMRNDEGQTDFQTRRVLALHRLYKRAVGDNDLGALKLYMQLVGAAEVEARKLKTEMLKMALWHIDKYLDSFIRYERAGKPPPDVHPDPRDIHIDPNGNVTIDGPMSAEERDQQAMFVDCQLGAVEGLRALRRRRHTLDATLFCRMERKLKRQLGKLNRELPSRLRQQSWEIMPENSDDDNDEGGDEAARGE